MDQTPKLTAWEYENGERISLIVWCKYCKKYHWHGASGKDRGKGHRVAHCILKTPYQETGYELIPAGSTPSDIKKDLNLKKPKGPKSFSECKEKISNANSFTTFIKKQTSRNDPLGDYAIDFAYILDNMPMYPECRGTDELTSETLYGHYLFLADYAKKRDYVLETLCSLWKEWLGYKHIGLKFGEPRRGYVYVFKLENEDDVFKIGRTKKEPEKRLLEIAHQERAKVVLYDWIQINFYDIIEKELHTTFKKNQIAREWFRIDRKKIDETIHIYSLTDQTCIINSVAL